MIERVRRVCSIKIWKFSFIFLDLSHTNEKHFEFRIESDKRKGFFNEIFRGWVCKEASWNIWEITFGSGNSYLNRSFEWPERIRMVTKVEGNKSFLVKLFEKVHIFKK